MQSLLSAVKEQFIFWPNDEDYFTCDPDGEVRGNNTIGNDFYPEVEIFECHRSTECGSNDGDFVTKEMFESK